MTSTAPSVTPVAKPRLSREERQVSIRLAMLFAVRMLGLFLLTPVFADAALSLSGGDQKWLVGMALGAYGMTQALMQIPFGLLSDRFGRRPIILVGLSLFVLGGVICALSDAVVWILVGRAIQGLGAVSAAITAWVADATRPEVRTKAMAMVGGSIGFSFAASMVLSPILVHALGLSGLFWVISLLGFLCLLLATFLVPSYPMHDPAISHVPVRDVLRNSSLIRLNIGVFLLHFVLMALFVVLPSLLIAQSQLHLGQLWQVYAPVIVLALVLMVPAIIVIETRYYHRQGLLWSVGVLALLFFVWSWASYSFWVSVAMLVVFFVIFNVLEGLQPSMVSRVTPAQHKGLALGLFNMCQAAGVATGSIAGGLFAQHASVSTVFGVNALVLLLWLACIWRLPPIAKPVAN